MPDHELDVRRATERFQTETGWLDSRHSFAFGPHRDRDNTHHGLLLVSNDDVVEAGSGFETHPHRDMEIVTWVLEGELEHRDSIGNSGLIHPGLAQRMSAGRGILHSEINPLGDAPVRFVQMWVVPDTESIEPGYAQRDVERELASGELFPVASGAAGSLGREAAIRIRQRGATLWAGRPRPGSRLKLPRATYGHLFVARGAVTLEGAGRLEQGDAVRLTASDAESLLAHDEGAEVLYWQMDSSLSD